VVLHPYINERLFYFSVSSWNVRGLGDADKCDQVHADLRSFRPRIVGLQETKLGPILGAKAVTFLPSNIRTFESVDSIGASGAILSAWDESLFSLEQTSPSRHILSFDLSLRNDSCTFRFSNIYAPAIVPIKKHSSKPL
jgi:hypothetical protein